MRQLPFSVRLRLRRIPLRLSSHPKVPSGIPEFAATAFKTYKLRNKILAGGKNILFGNTVSEFKNKSRRTWRPNIKRKHIWSETLERRIKLKMVTSVMRTIEKVGGLDSYLTCTTRRRMKELGPRGWELRAMVIKLMRERERGKYVRMFQRSIMLCPMLRMDSEWKDIRPFVQHTEGYAVLPEHVCKKAFENLMERMREGRPMTRRISRLITTCGRKRGTHARRVRRPQKKVYAKTAIPRPKKKPQRSLKTLRKLELAVKEGNKKLNKRALPMVKVAKAKPGVKSRKRNKNVHLKG